MKKKNISIFTLLFFSLGLLTGCVTVNDQSSPSEEKESSEISSEEKSSEEESESHSSSFVPPVVTHKIEFAEDYSGNYAGGTSLTIGVKIDDTASNDFSIVIVSGSSYASVSGKTINFASVSDNQVVTIKARSETYDIETPTISLNVLPHVLSFASNYGGNVVDGYQETFAVNLDGSPCTNFVIQTDSPYYVTINGASAVFNNNSVNPQTVKIKGYYAPYNIYTEEVTYVVNAHSIAFDGTYGGTVKGGEAVNFQVRIDNVSSNDFVLYADDNTYVSISNHQITFANVNEPQTVRIHAHNNTYNIDTVDAIYNLIPHTISYNGTYGGNVKGGDVVNFSINIDDNPSNEFTLVADKPALVTINGNSVTFNETSVNQVVKIRAVSAQYGDIATNEVIYNLGPHALSFASSYGGSVVGGYQETFVVNFDGEVTSDFELCTDNSGYVDINGSQVTFKNVTVTQTIHIWAHNDSHDLDSEQATYTLNPHTITFVDNFSHDVRPGDVINAQSLIDGVASNEFTINATDTTYIDIDNANRTIIILDVESVQTVDIRLKAKEFSSIYSSYITLTINPHTIVLNNVSKNVNIGDVETLNVSIDGNPSNKYDVVIDKPSFAIYNEDNHTITFTEVSVDTEVNVYVTAQDFSKQSNAITYTINAVTHTIAIKSGYSDEVMGGDSYTFAVNIDSVLTNQFTLLSDKPSLVSIEGATVTYGNVITPTVVTIIAQSNQYGVTDQVNITINPHIINFHGSYGGNVKGGVAVTFKADIDDVASDDFTLAVDNPSLVSINNKTITFNNVTTTQTVKVHAVSDTYGGIKTNDVTYTITPHVLAFVSSYGGDVYGGDNDTLAVTVDGINTNDFSLVASDNTYVTINGNKVTFLDVDSIQTVNIHAISDTYGGIITEDVTYTIYPHEISFDGTYGGSVKGGYVESFSILIDGASSNDYELLTDKPALVTINGNQVTFNIVTSNQTVKIWAHNDAHDIITEKVTYNINPYILAFKENYGGNVQGGALVNFLVTVDGSNTNQFTLVADDSAYVDISGNQVTFRNVTAPQTVKIHAVSDYYGGVVTPDATFTINPHILTFDGTYGGNVMGCGNATFIVNVDGSNTNQFTLVADKPSLVTINGNQVTFANVTTAQTVKIHAVSDYYGGIETGELTYTINPHTLAFATTYGGSVKGGVAVTFNVNLDGASSNDFVLETDNPSYVTINGSTVTFKNVTSNQNVRIRAKNTTYDIYTSYAEYVLSAHTIAFATTYGGTVRAETNATLLVNIDGVASNDYSLVASNSYASINGNQVTFANVSSQQTVSIYAVSETYGGIQTASVTYTINPHTIAYNGSYGSTIKGGYVETFNVNIDGSASSAFTLESDDPSLVTINGNKVTFNNVTSNQTVKIRAKSTAYNIYTSYATYTLTPHVIGFVGDYGGNVKGGDSVTFNATIDGVSSNDFTLVASPSDCVVINGRTVTFQEVAHNTVVEIYGICNSLGGIKTSTATYTIIPQIAPPTHGYFPTALWTNAVAKNSYTFGANTNSYTTVYAAKDANNIYVYAKQHVQSLNNKGDAWWQKDNIEMHVTKYLDNSYAHFADQIFASTNGDIYSSSGATGYVTTSPSKDDTGLYYIEYELKIPYYSDISYSDDLVMHFGTNLDAGFSRDGNGWSDSFETNRNALHITTNGLMRNSGTELLTEPITASGTVWSSGVYTLRLDGTKDFELRYEFNHFMNATPSEWGYSFAGDVYSDSWANGGISFRGDWWTWGTWASGGLAHEIMGGDGKWCEYQKDMDVVLDIAYSASTHRVYLAYTYTSNHSSYKNVKGYVCGSSNEISFSGVLNVGVGYTDTGTSGIVNGITFKSVQLIKGTIL